MGFLKHNWWLKLISLVAAVLLALYVNREADLARSTLFRPILIEPAPGQRVKEVTPGTTLTVNLEGPLELIRDITSDDLGLNIDTSKVLPGKRSSVPVEVTLPEKYQPKVLLDWRPRVVQVLLESDAVKRLPILLRPLSPPDGWVLREAPRANPNTAEISGPREVVDGVNSLVASFPLEAEESLNVTADVRAVDANGNLLPEGRVDLKPYQVNVSALLERVVLQKRVPVQPLFQVRDGSRITVESVKPAEVQVIGPKRVVAGVYVIETRTLTLPAASGRVTRQVALSPPPGVTVNPGTVAVTLKVAGR
jgi:YbbR domain-containing protein